MRSSSLHAPWSGKSLATAHVGSDLISAESIGLIIDFFLLFRHVVLFWPLTASSLASRAGAVNTPVPFDGWSIADCAILVL